MLLLAPTPRLTILFQRSICAEERDSERGAIERFPRSSRRGRRVSVDSASQQLSLTAHTEHGARTGPGFRVGLRATESLAEAHVSDKTLEPREEGLAKSSNTVAPGLRGLIGRASGSRTPENAVHNVRQLIGLPHAWTAGEAEDCWDLYLA